MTRKIVFYKNYFLDFYKNLDKEVKTKIQYVFELIQQVENVPVKFLKSIAGYDGVFEIRVEYQSNIYRIFCTFDEGKLVVVFNGFQKKSQKTPKQVLEKAYRLKNEYFINKK